MQPEEDRRRGGFRPRVEDWSGVASVVALELRAGWCFIDDQGWAPPERGEVDEGRFIPRWRRVIIHARFVTTRRHVRACAATLDGAGPLLFCHRSSIQLWNT
jgi:hypothetical protein